MPVVVKLMWVYIEVTTPTVAPYLDHTIKLIVG